MKDIEYIVSILSVITSVCLLQNNTLKRNLKTNKHMKLLVNTIFVMGFLAIYDKKPLYVFLLSMVYLSFIHQ